MPDKKTPVRSSFILGQFLIDTANKTVSIQEYWEKDEFICGERLHSWGIDYVVDSLINFATTCLYITEDQITFKEYYRPPQVQDIHKASPDEIEGYKLINSFYEKEGRFFYLIGPNRLKELDIQEGIDFAQLTRLDKKPYRHEHGYYYYDNQGLYFLEDYYDKRIFKVASAKNCIPVIKSNYCEYNGEAFQNAQKIADTSQLTEIDMFHDGQYMYVTDGKTVFYTQYTDRKEIPDIDKWIQLTAGENLTMKDSSVYLEHEITANKVLFATPEGFRIVDKYLMQNPIKVNQVFIKFADKYEPLEIEKYKLFIKSFYEYKDQFFFNGISISNTLDMPKLKYLKDKYGNNSAWLSDGKSLTHCNCLMKNTNKVTTHEATFNCVPVADIYQLKPVNEKILIDNINFYLLTGHKIEVIPINSLGFQVDINLSTFAYYIQ